jgi:hypothetical protein
MLQSGSNRNGRRRRTANTPELYTFANLLRVTRNILRSIVIAVPMVTAVYFMMNVAYMTVLSIPEMTSSPAVAVVIIVLLYKSGC